MTVHLTLPFPPSLNALYRTFRGRMILSREGRAFKRAAADTAALAGLRPMDGRLVVWVTLYRPQRRGDLDNYLKATLDSCNGILWGDDRQLVRITATLRDDKQRPRVELAARRTWWPGE